MLNTSFNKEQEVTKLSGLTELRNRVLPEKSLRITAEPDGSYSASSKPINESRGFIGDIVHAVDTIGYDPGNHKKKALGYTALAGGLGAVTAATLLRRNGLSSRVTNLTPRSALTTALTMAAPALSYYAMRNKDSRPKLISGGLGSMSASLLAGIQAASTNRGNQVPQVPASTTPPPNPLANDEKLPDSVKNNPFAQAMGRIGDTYGKENATAHDAFRAGLQGTPYEHLTDAQLARMIKDTAIRGISPSATRYSALAAFDEFQQAEDNEKLKAIAADPKLTPEQRRQQMEMITEGKDLFTRYPAFRYMPGGSTLREKYNNHYYPIQQPTDNVGSKLPNVGRGNTGFFGKVFGKTKPFYNTYDVPESLQSESALNSAFASPNPASDFVRSKIRE